MIYYILSIWGATHILVSSKLLENFRNWLLIFIPFLGEMLNCYQCTSFWVSMIFYFIFDNLNIGISPFEILGKNVDLTFIIISFIGSGLTSLIAVFVSYIIKMSK